MSDDRQELPEDPIVDPQLIFTDLRRKGMFLPFGLGESLRTGVMGSFFDSRSGRQTISQAASSDARAISGSKRPLSGPTNQRSSQRMTIGLRSVPTPGSTTESVTLPGAGR